HEDDVCWIADCTICATPMVVWRRHGVDVPEADRAHMLNRLAEVAAQVFDGHYFDDNMRNIPDHFHVHARPEGAFFGHGFRRGAGATAPGAGDRSGDGGARCPASRNPRSACTRPSAARRSSTSWSSGSTRGSPPTC